MFTIKSVSARTYDTSFGGYPWRVDVSVEMPAADWARAKKLKQLGQLYGVDISNAVYAVNENIPAHNPSVDDTKRAAGGIKRISLTYFLRDADRAERLGLKVMRLKNGDVVPGFADFVNIPLVTNVVSLDAFRTSRAS